MLGWICLLRVSWRLRRSGSGSGSGRGCVWLVRLSSEETEDLTAQRLRVFAHVGARTLWRRAQKECRREGVIRAGVVGDQVCCAINSQLLDAIGRTKGLHI